MLKFYFNNNKKTIFLFLQPELIESIEEFKRGRDVFPKLPAAIDVSSLKL